MKLKTKVLALLLALLALCMAACGERNDENLDTANESGSESIAETEAAPTCIDIVKDGKVATIVYPATADGEVLELVNSLSGTLQKLTGLSGLRPQVEGTVHNPDTVEILIGHTNYPESKQVYESLGYGEGMVCVVGNKVVVAGFDTAACKRAMSSLTVALSSGKDENGNISLATDYSITISDRPLVSALPVLNTTNFPRVENAGQGASKLTFTKVTAQETKDYVAKLEQAGYTKHAENKIDNNLFYTYYNKDAVVTVMWADRSAADTMSVTVDPVSMTNLVPAESENRWTKTTTSTFTQVGLYYDEDKEANQAKLDMQYFNGMCYVMRLEDGSFIVMDGGHASAGHADRLYEVLKKQAPDPNKIVIAAWFFSHDHGDHVGFFPSFANKYSSKVTVEAFVHSFPFTSGDDEVSLMRGKFAGAKIYKSHAGQKYYLRNATVEILYTSDLYLTNVEDMEDTNNASQVFRITANNTRFMIFGDYSENGTTMLELYSKATLKSDVMQFAHHGISGMSDQMNKTVEASYVFWPVAMLTEDVGENAKAGWVYWMEEAQRSSNLLGRGANDYVVNTVPDENVFVAQDDVFVATFGNGTLSATRYDTVADYVAGTVAE